MKPRGREHRAETQLPPESWEKADEANCPKPFVKDQFPPAKVFLATHPNMALTYRLSKSPGCFTFQVSIQRNWVGGIVPHASLLASPPSRSCQQNAATWPRNSLLDCGETVVSEIFHSEESVRGRVSLLPLGEVTKEAEVSKDGRGLFFFFWPRILPSLESKTWVPQ